MEAKFGQKSHVFGVVLLRKEQQKRRATALTSAAPEQPNSAQQRQKWIHTVPACDACLIVKFYLSNQLGDDPMRGSFMVVALTCVKKKSRIRGNASVRGNQALMGWSRVPVP